MAPYRQKNRNRRLIFCGFCAIMGLCILSELNVLTGLFYLMNIQNLFGSHTRNLDKH